MKFKLDENLPLVVAVELRARTMMSTPLGKKGLPATRTRISGELPNALVAS